MAFDSSADLLFTIGANADDAQNNIQRFRGVLGKDLAAIKGEFADWSRQVFGDLGTFEGKLTAVTAAGLAGLVAITAGAAKVATELFQAGRAAAEYAGEIDDAGDKTGLSAERLSRLRYAAEMVGVPFGSLTNALVKFTQSTVEAQEPTSKQARAFDRLGISEAAVKAGAEDMFPLLEEVADAFERQASAVEKSAIAKDLFSRGGAELVEFLSLGSRGLREFSAEADKLGLVLSDRNLRSAQEFQFQLTAVDQALKGLKVTVGLEVLPTLNMLFLGVEAGIRTIQQASTKYEQQPWWMSLIPGGREIATFKDSEGVFERELVEAYQRMQRRLAGLFEGQGADRLLPGAEGVKDMAADFAGVTGIVDGLRRQMAGLLGPEEQVAAEAGQIRIELARAAAEMVKLRDAGKISPESWQQQIAALADAAALIPELIASKVEAARQQQANTELAVQRDLEDRLAALGEDSWERRERAWIGEVDALRASLAQRVEISDRHLDLLLDLETAGLRNIRAERSDAFQGMLVDLQGYLQQAFLSRATAQERLEYQYQLDLQRFSEVEEAKQLARRAPEEYASTQAQFALNRKTVLEGYSRDLAELQNSQGWQGVFGSAFREGLRQDEAALRQWQERGSEAFQMTALSLTVLEGIGQRAFRNFAQGMAQNVAYALVYSKSVGEAMRSALASTLESIAAESFVQAIYSTALGFLRLAQHQFAAAGQAFTAAGIFGGVGAAAAIAGRAIAPKQEAAGGAGGTEQGSSAGVSGGASTGTEERGARVQIIVQGPIVGASGIEEFLELVNDAVENRDVRMVATSTRQSARGTQ